MLLSQEYQELYNQSDLSVISITLLSISVIALLFSIILLFKFFIKKREEIKMDLFFFCIGLTCNGNDNEFTMVSHRECVN